jgi:Tfp pilus assembly protein PilN
MTAQVNLLPLSYRLRQQRAHRVKRIVSAAALLLIVELIGAGILSEMSRDMRETQSRIRQMHVEQHELQVKVAEMRDRHARLNRQVQLVDDLKRKHRWSEVLVLITESLPETVVLTEVQTVPSQPSISTVVRVRQPSESRRNRPGTPETPDIPSHTAEGLLIAGIATDHSSVAALLRDLNRRSRFGRCHLESTNETRFEPGEGIAFTIRTEW